MYFKKNVILKEAAPYLQLQRGRISVGSSEFILLMSKRLKSRDWSRCMPSTEQIRAVNKNPASSSANNAAGKKKKKKYRAPMVRKNAYCLLIWAINLRFLNFCGGEGESSEVVGDSDGQISSKFQKQLS